MFHFDKLNDRENLKFEARNNASYSINYSFKESVNLWLHFRIRSMTEKFNIQHSKLNIQNFISRLLLLSQYQFYE
jgi:hypothetical protein